MHKACLRHIDLSEANLKNAILSETDLRGANFRGANLLGAILSRSDLREADFRGANLSNVNFDKAEIGVRSHNLTRFEDAVLDGASFEKVHESLSIIGDYYDIY